MADEDPRSLKDKLLFYTTAFFILLGTFSLFAFLFLVPFVIEPAFTTIFMHFDTRPAMCVTVDTVQMRGVSNCTWSSCREGCTKELFECFQIQVNYKAARNATNDTEAETPGTVGRHEIRLRDDGEQYYSRERRAIRDYSNYDDGESYYVDSSARLSLAGNAIAHKDQLSYNDDALADQYTDLDYGGGNGSSGAAMEWFIGGRLFPNVKGCGYPPSLNCTIWTKKYKQIGTNFSCYYSMVDPALVITDLDLRQNLLNLIYSMAIPIPSFIISVIYLAVAYFKIYNDDEEQAPLDKNAEEIASTADCCEQDGEIGDGLESGSSSSSSGGSGASVPDVLMDGPENDLLRSHSGESVHVQLNDEAEAGSRGSTCNLSKTMTTSISTPPGPIAAV